MSHPKIYVYPADLSACGWYRMIWPAQALQAQGHDITIVMPGERTQEDYQIFGDMKGDTLTNVRYPQDAEVIVLQRITHKLLWQAIPLMRANGVSVIIDIDDDLGKVHPTNPAYKWLHPKNTGDHSYVNLDKACSVASWVITSTPALQKVYAPHGRGTVLENMIPQSMLDTPRNDGGCFGWTGYLLSHPNDPQVTGTAVQRLVREGFKFSMVGNPEGIAREFRITDDEVNATGVVPITEWPNALATLHVGMAPLAATSFNESKSWLKPQELAAVGVPCVMTPRPAYRTLHNLGVGVLANSPKDWYREIKRLMTDDAWYEEVANRSKAAVSLLTIEQNAFRWLETWQTVWLNERRQSSDLFYRADV
jgi:glycosyltransferase involved in cell wall biosynthesis